MSTDNPPRVEECTCLAVRQAARRITQFYDQHLAPVGLRTTQFSILSRLRRKGPMAINALAADMVMDRTTLGRNILPLERDGLIRIDRSAFTSISIRSAVLRQRVKPTARERRSETRVRNRPKYEGLPSGGLP